MKRVRIGVIGCGAVAQVQHLPFLAELADEYEIAIVCDLSPATAEYAAGLFHVPAHVTDYRDVLASDVDAVLLCQTDPKTQATVDAFDAGKHVLIEKPMCYSLQEADAIIAAAERSGKVGMVGYMKLYEPAFEAARDEVATIDDVRLIQINHMHPNPALHLRQFRIRSFDDIPPRANDHIQMARQAALRDAIGDSPPYVQRAFLNLSISMIHDLYGLRVLFGVPTKVISTDIWADGEAISTVLEYAAGYRCIATWVDLPELWDLHETLEVYGGNKRVIVSYATGFSRLLSTLTIHEIDPEGRSIRKQPALDWEIPFRRELRHFHECITSGVAPRSPVSDARHDIALIIDIVKAEQTLRES